MLKFSHKIFHCIVFFLLVGALAYARPGIWLGQSLSALEPLGPDGQVSKS